MIPRSMALAALATAALLAAPAAGRAHESGRYVVVSGPAAAGYTVAEERGVRVLRGLSRDAVVLVDTATGRSWVLGEGLTWRRVVFAHAEAAPVRVLLGSKRLRD